MKIQQEESPKYDRLFINFGSFHTELAFSRSIGSYIELREYIVYLLRPWKSCILMHSYVY